MLHAFATLFQFMVQVKIDVKVAMCNHVSVEIWTYSSFFLKTCFIVLGGTE